MHLRQEGRHLLVHPEAPRWSVVNEVGYQVIQLCDGRHTMAEITAAIAQTYGLTPADVRPDVQAYLKQLRQAGLLADGEAAERSQPAAPGLTHLHLHLTRRCNLHCAHCAVVMGDRQEPGVLSTERIMALIDEFAAVGGRSVALTGGEPLLHPDVLAIIEHAARRLHTILATNGTLITDRVAMTVSELGVVVQISMDGATAQVHDRIRGEGSFRQTWRGIERLQRAGAGERLNLCMTVMRRNAHQVADLIDLAEAHSVPGVRFYPLQRLGRAAAAWSDLALDTDTQIRLYRYLYLVVPQQRKRVRVSAELPGLQLRLPEERPWCALGRTLAVDANGDIYPCSMLMVPDCRLGTVENVGLEKVVKSLRLRRLCERCAARKEAIGRCRTCTWRNFCQGGCAGSVLAEKGTLWATDDLCQVRRHLYREIVFDLATDA